ncbi:hypothetical protein AAIB42_09420 [Streptococcus ruminicola]|uniref:hypothetical protein n=1 Tax=Streptococcus ruminicola TaxID=2686210 RepID=UPI003F615051
MKKNAKNLKRVSLASAAILTAFTLPTVVCPDQSTTVHADEVTQSVQQDNKNQSVQQDGATQSVQQDSTTQSVQQDGATQSVQQDSTTQSVQQDSTTQSVQQDSTTQSVQQDSTTQSVQQDSTTQSVQQDGATQSVQQEYENWTENGTHYSFTDSPIYNVCGNSIWDSDRELLLGVTNEDPTTNVPEGYVLNESYKYNGKYMNVEIEKDSILADWSRYASYRMYFFTKVAPSTDTPSVDPKQDEPTKGDEITYGYEQFGKDYANFEDGYSNPYFYTDDPIFISAEKQDGKVYYKPTGQESPILYTVIPNGWELDSSNPMNNNFINYYGGFAATPDVHYYYFSAKVQFIRPTNKPGSDEPGQGENVPTPAPSEDQPSKGEDTPTPAPSEDQPSKGEDVPTVDPSQDEPSKGEDVPTPAPSEDKPSKGEDTPSRGTDTPSRGTDTPSRGTDTPSRGTDTPSRGTDTPSRGTDTPSRGTDTPSRGTDTPSRGTDTPNRGADTPNSQTEGTSRNVNTTPVVAEGQIKTIKKTVKPIEKPSSISYGNSSYVAPTSIKKDSLTPSTQSINNKQTDDNTGLPSTGESTFLSTLLTISGVAILLSLFGIKAYRKN